MRGAWVGHKEQAKWWMEGCNTLCCASHRNTAEISVDWPVSGKGACMIKREMEGTFQRQLPLSPRGDTRQMGAENLEFEDPWKGEGRRSQALEL